MKNIAHLKLLASSVAVAIFCHAGSAGAEITLLARGALPGTALDGSGLTGLLEDGVTPHNLAGGFGSAITYTGVGNRYLATPDRGPADGTTSYIDRFYELDMPVTFNGTAYSITPTIVRTQLLEKSPGQYFTGSSAAFNTVNPTDGLRLDPEGVRLGRTATHFYMSDEYGPFVYEFDRATGQRTRIIDVPNKFLIANPSVTGSAELPPANSSGRQANRGMEGLAISPDGSKLYGIMQSPLIQDNALNSSNGRIGTNVRMLEIDIANGTTREFLYQMDNRSNGVNEILAVNDHEFLVIERDGRAGSNATFKQIFKIDIANATDVSSLASLPTSVTPAGVMPVTKTLFIDLLNPSFGLAGASFPEKIEGLAFGPDLPDGRHLLMVASDNDFISANPTDIYAFAIDSTSLPGFQPQMITPVPELSSIAMFAAGFGLLGFMHWRRGYVSAS